MLETNYKKGEILVATESGSGLLANGKEVRWTKGRTRVRAGTEVAERWPDFFAPDDTIDHGLEDASRDPGRGRSAKV